MGDRAKEMGIKMGLGEWECTMAIVAAAAYGDPPRRPWGRASYFIIRATLSIPWPTMLSVGDGARDTKAGSLFVQPLVLVRDPIAHAP